MTKRVWFDVTPAEAALLRQARAALDEEHGERLGDGAVLAALCRTSLERPCAVDPSGTRPAYQVAITRCPDCERSTQNGSGVERDLTKAEAERAQCDAEVIAAGARATATVSPALRRRVFARDQYRCVVPGCRSARNLDLHHVVFQSHGGRHELKNLCLLCSAHHTACHDRKVSITGSAPELTFTFHRDGCEDAHRERGGEDPNTAGPETLSEPLAPCACPARTTRPTGDWDVPAGTSRWDAHAVLQAIPDRPRRATWARRRRPAARARSQDRAAGAQSSRDL